VAYGAYRIEFTFMVAAQSAATAAVMADRMPTIAVQSVRLRATAQDALLADKQVLAAPLARDERSEPPIHDVFIHCRRSWRTSIAASCSPSGCRVAAMRPCGDQAHSRDLASIRRSKYGHHDRLRRHGREGVAADAGGAPQAGKPNALGWWAPIENGAMFNGLYMDAAVNALEAHEVGGRCREGTQAHGGPAVAELDQRSERLRGARRDHGWQVALPDGLE